VIIRWPSGTIDVIDNPSSDQSLLVVEGSSPLAVSNFNNATFSLYPVPTKNILNINADNSVVMKTAQIFDLTGKMIQESIVKDGAVNVESLTKGNYIIKLIDASGKVYAQKFNKQ
jgi:hypothetical protein